jgi:hypothetical protein
MNWTKFISTIENANLDFLAGHPFIYHCHHFNLFLDQTIDDFFGAEHGITIRTSAARASSYHFLSNLFNRLDLETPAEKLTLAQTIFSAFGHGRLFMNANKSGGTADGEFLHYSYAWKEKYGDIVRRQSPVDAFAAGYAAGTLEACYDTDHSFKSIETDCYALKAERCHFQLEPEPRSNINIQTDEKISLSAIHLPCSGLQEDRIVSITAGLRDFLSAVAGDDEHGLVDAFGVFVTRHMPNYYNQISFELLNSVKQNNPDLYPIAESLIRESGHVCVFNTFGGILYSPEWDAMVGRIEGELEEVVSSCMAIARALGFGSWAISELSEQRFVLRAVSEYESPFCIVNDFAPKQNNSYFIQGAAVAIMRLWQAIDWQKRPDLTQELYNQLFNDNINWHVEQTQSLAAGNLYTEVVVTR